jgi:hypothetical protein
MVENWSRDWTGWRTYFGLMLKYSNPPLQTTATAFPATMRPLKAFQGIEQQILDIETIFHMLRLLFSFKSPPLSMAINR